MDIDGVDVEFLGKEEIQALFDSNDTCQISYDNLADENIEEIYDDIISSENNGNFNTDDIPEDYILNLNNDILDENGEDIVLESDYATRELPPVINHSIDLNTISNDELLVIYDDVLSEGDLITYAAKKCTDFKQLPNKENDYGNYVVYMTCYDAVNKTYFTMSNYGGDSGNYATRHHATCYFACSGAKDGSGTKTCYIPAPWGDGNSGYKEYYDTRVRYSTKGGTFKELGICK